jgi:hypothetical protein
VGPHPLGLGKVASRDWIKNDYIVKQIPCPLSLATTNIEYPDKFTDVFPDESLETVTIQ